MPVEAKFAVVGSDGRCYWADPKREAYAQMAWLQIHGRRTTLTVENGEYKVESPGLATIIFCQVED